MGFPSSRPQEGTRSPPAGCRSRSVAPEQAGRQQSWALPSGRGSGESGRHFGEWGQQAGWDRPSLASRAAGPRRRQVIPRGVLNSCCSACQQDVLLPPARNMGPEGILLQKFSGLGHQVASAHCLPHCSTCTLIYRISQPTASRLQWRHGLSPFNSLCCPGLTLPPHLAKTGDTGLDKDKDRVAYTWVHPTQPSDCSTFKL